jgi:hypothetical protein
MTTSGAELPVPQRSRGGKCCPFAVIGRGHPNRLMQAVSSHTDLGAADISREGILTWPSEQRTKTPGRFAPRARYHAVLFLIIKTEVRIVEGHVHVWCKQLKFYLFGGELLACSGQGSCRSGSRLHHRKQCSIGPKPARKSDEIRNVGRPKSMPRRLNFAKYRSTIENDEQITFRVRGNRLTRKAKPHRLNEHERIARLFAKRRQHPD